MGSTDKLRIIVGEAARSLVLPYGQLSWAEVQSQVADELHERLREVPADAVVRPQPHTTGPIAIGLWGSAGIPDLRALYVELLAKSMDTRTCGSIHPAFASVLGQLTSDEARLLPALARGSQLPIRRGEFRRRREDKRSFYIERKFVLTTVRTLSPQVELEFPLGLSTYLVNLARLGVLTLDWDVEFSHPQSNMARYILHDNYKLIEEEPETIQLREQATREGLHFQLWGEEARFAGVPPSVGVASPTEFGLRFAVACVPIGELREESDDQDVD